ncbi:transcriptional regulator [[Clostridium] sordellii]|uniref:hypothetical protein n=1 Tax=Paraclostridium sordellii TaxID=1505 RepID=UPI000541B9C0|nr:hypothetical protein [Paeniclostridium sordellii]CEK36494.1 transcriptional regulator [[Clostridium] sordellii] [Paeniclostridium sordellii]
MKEKIKQLYLKGHNAKEIFSIINNNIYLDEGFNFNIENIEKYINDDLNKYKRNYRSMRSQRIKILYANGYNYKEIAKIIKDNMYTIRTNINRNCFNCKEDHIRNRALSKEIKRTIDNTNNSYISNSSLLKQNRQAYTYNKNLNITFDENVNGVRTIDTPKTFYHNR